MGLVILLLLLMIIFGVIGIFTALKWALIIALVLLVLSIVFGSSGYRSRW